MLAERWRADAIAVYSMHPGWVRTGGLDEALPRFARLARPLLRDPQQGADTAVWLLALARGPIGPERLLARSAPARRCTACRGPGRPTSERRAGLGRARPRSAASTIGRASATRSG